MAPLSSQSVYFVALCSAMLIAIDLSGSLGVLSLYGTMRMCLVHVGLSLYVKYTHTYMYVYHICTYIYMYICIHIHVETYLGARQTLVLVQDGLTGSAWGDWANYTASPLRAFENELGVQAPVGFWDPAGFTADGSTENFARRRQTELKHGRISMLAT